jgi:type II secretory pathway pseudopilin PulG
MNRHMHRGMTIPELLISFGILLLVLGLATALFKQAFTHVTLTTENMTNEQSARVAMARVNNSLSQASVDANSGDTGNGTPAPAIISSMPPATSTPAITFYRVYTLDPTAIQTGSSKAPEPKYYVHIISYDPVAQTVNEYSMDYNQVYKAGGASPAPTVLAKNVTNFGIMAISNVEYQFQITVNNIDNPTQAEAPYTLVDNVHLMN